MTGFQIALLAYFAIAGLFVFALCRAAARGDRMADEQQFKATGERMQDRPADAPSTPGIPAE